MCACAVTVRMRLHGESPEETGKGQPEEQAVSRGQLCVCVCAHKTSVFFESIRPFALLTNI